MAAASSPSHPEARLCIHIGMRPSAAFHHTPVPPHPATGNSPGAHQLAMSDTQTYDYADDPDVNPEAAEEQDNLADLRRAAKDSSKAKREAEALKKELALLKAGVDTDSPLGRMFAKSYDGELTTDAVKASWAELAPPPVDTSTTDDAAGDADNDLTPEEQASTAERNTLANGASSTSEPDVDPRVTAEAAGRKVIDDGGTELDGMAVHFGQLVAAAQAGDRRVIWDPRA